MVKPSKWNDILYILRGLNKIGSSVIEINKKEINRLNAHSSFKNSSEKFIESLKNIRETSIKEKNLNNFLSETVERLSVVRQSIDAFLASSEKGSQLQHDQDKNLDESTEHSQNMLEGILEKDSKNVLENLDFLAGQKPQIIEDLSNLSTEAKLKIEKLKDFKPESLYDSRFMNGQVTDEQLDAIGDKINELQGSEFLQDAKIFDEINNSDVKEKQNIQSSSSQVRSKSHLKSNEINSQDRTFQDSSQKRSFTQLPKLIKVKPLAKEQVKSTLSVEAHARKVPSSRLSRLATFGSLAAGLGIGTLAEMTRRSVGLEKKNTAAGALLDSSSFLTEANAKRIVDTLCKVRGAALKLGQIMSIQDNTLISPTIQKMFERVRQSADFMPTWQLERTLVKEFGQEWRSLVAKFDEKPFAAASIGQVHQATLHDGRKVAMKIQYPGVAEGIESDINNLISTLNVARIIPEGMFIDSVIEVAKRELSWECDYIRERECTQKFKELLETYPHYYVPDIVPELCSKRIFTNELIDGLPVDQCVNLDQETRNRIASLVLELSLKELFEYRYIQSDPNWSNFFYNLETKQLILLDFGACRDYKKSFVDMYIQVIHGAASKDREKVYEYSKQLKFLTGYEAKVMVEAHIDAVMILGKPFQTSEPFDFGDQEITKKIQKLIPIMLNHRMIPPPEEIYSLHRKMSGIFLLATKLGAVVECKSFFDRIWANYKFGEEDV